VQARHNVFEILFKLDNQTQNRLACAY